MFRGYESGQWIFRSATGGGFASADTPTLVDLKVSNGDFTLDTSWPCTAWRRGRSHTNANCYFDGTFRYTHDSCDHYVTHTNRHKCRDFVD